MNPTTKRYLVSTVVTFAAGFCITILPQLDTITLESIKTGAVSGVLFAGVRAGMKAVVETFVAWYTSK